ncbi:DUF1349 domain-containing protein [Portibacter lacus]|nr:DUF1349 domain-containing protein [Portibacter lacus]
MRNIVWFFIFFFISVNVLMGQQSALNDEFNSPCNLSDWNNITEVEGWMTPGGQPAEHLEEFDISRTYPGDLYMMPWTTSWYADLRGALIFKEITGDFVFTTRIIVRNRAGLDQLPSTVYSLAGMMIRSPRNFTNGISGWTAGGENYVFLSIGRANTNANGPFQLEVKNTINSNSNLNISNIGVSEIYMRMVKVNGTILVMRSFDNITWVVHRRYSRPDLPETCQIGYVTYTDWPAINAHWDNNIANVMNSNTNILNDDYSTDFNWNPDLIGRFSFARFNDVNLPQENENTDFMTADEGLILSLFGYPTVPLYPEGSKIWNGSQSNDWGNVANWNGSVPIAGDYVVIPNCNCTEMNAPSLTSDSPLFSGFHLEKGAQFTVESGITLSVDLQGTGSAFINEGVLENHGIITITNALGKEIHNTSSLTNYSGSALSISED